MRLPRFLLAAALLSVPASAEPVRVYLIGNSLTDELKYDDWIALAKDGGVEALYARKMIPGAPIGWHKEHPNEGFLTGKFGPPEKAFKEFIWDALTLQPFRSGEAEPALYYANLLWETNPDARVFVYAQWPSRSAETDWLKAFANMRQALYVDVFEALRSTPKGSQVFLIPAGWAIERLHYKARLGLVPGIRSAWELYSDGVHVNNIASYLIATCFYATIFHKSPVGLPIGKYQGDKASAADYFEITPQLAKIIQETVWETVTSMPETGVTSKASPAFSVAAAPHPVTGEPYEARLFGAYGRPPYRFSVTEGGLPSGIVLAEDGALSGTPTASGRAKATVMIQDAAGDQASAPLALEAVPDTVPKVATTSLPPLRQGDFVSVQLAAENGNGEITWSVASGALPAGMSLDPSGRLSGSPALTGTYFFTARAQDGDLKSPEFDEKVYSGEIFPCGPAQVILVRRAVSSIKNDGNFDPAEGWDLSRTATKKLAGDSDNAVRFDAQWADGRLHVAVEVEDAHVVNGAGTPDAAPADGIVFYFDGLNNREDTYNFDDKRLAFDVKGRGSREYSIGTGYGFDVKVQPTDKGYRAEAAFKLNDIGVPWRAAKDRNSDVYAGTVVGFDFVVHDRDLSGGGVSQIGWAGTDQNPVDPSGFGTLILQK